MQSINNQGLTITRIFDAPPELVWQAWVNPEFLMRWWGPKDFISPVAQIDLQVGGKYLFCLQAPDGQEFWSTGVYKEIEPLKKLVFTDSFADKEGNIVPASYYGMEGEFPLRMKVTLLFEEMDGKTKMTLTHVGLPEGKVEEQTQTSWNESFDKLVESLNT